MKIFREEHEDHRQFDFIYNAILSLDSLKGGVSYFHLQFLLKLGKYIGIVPDDAGDLLRELSFIRRKGFETIEQDLQALLDHNFGFVNPIAKNQKAEYLDYIISLYRHHFDQLHDIKSLLVLKEVMS